MERLINKTDKSRLSFLFTSGAARVAAAALALVIVAAAVFAVPAVRGAFGAKVEDNVLYRSENGDVVVRAVEPLETPEKAFVQWAPLTEKIMKSVTNVISGTITDITEISMTYLIEDHDVTDYWSLITIDVKDTIKGGLPKDEAVTFMFPVCSRFSIEGITPEKGKEYVFFLRRTEDLGTEPDYTTIADYMYSVQSYCLVPLEEIQPIGLLDVIGADKETCGQRFIDKLKEYFD